MIFLSTGSLSYAVVSNCTAQMRDPPLELARVVRQYFHTGACEELARVARQLRSQFPPISNETAPAAIAVHFVNV